MSKDIVAGNAPYRIPLGAVSILRAIVHKGDGAGVVIVLHRPAAVGLRGKFQLSAGVKAAQP